MKCPQKYEKPGNSTTYRSDTVMPSTGRWIKGCILPFPKKGDLRLAKNYRGKILISIAAKIYNALLRNSTNPKIEKIFRKNQNGFQRNRSTTSQILTIRRIFLRCTWKKPRGDNLIRRLFQDLWLYTRRKYRANTIRLRPTQRNRRSYKDAI